MQCRRSRKKTSVGQKEGRKRTPRRSLRIGIILSLRLNHRITDRDQKAGEIAAASAGQETPGPALLSPGIGVDHHREVLAEGSKTGALEEPVVTVVNRGIAPAALGVSSGAKSMKVGMSGIMSGQELGCQCHLTAGKASGPMEAT